MKVFSLFDVEGKGRVTLRDLKRVAKELGETMTGELVHRGRTADAHTETNSGWLINGYGRPLCWCIAGVGCHGTWPNLSCICHAH